MASIAKALHEVMSKVSYIQKTGKNAFHGYKYAGEADLLEKLRPAMLEAGLLLIPSITAVSPIDEHGVTTVRMEYILMHKDGEIWPHKIGAAGQGGDRNKNGVGDKGLYKAITGANKYLLFKLFQLETGDDPETYYPPMPAPGEDIIKKDVDVQTLTVDAQRPIFSELEKELSSCETVDEVKRWKVSARSRASRLSESWRKILEGKYLTHLRSIEKRDADDYIERATA
jgi:ERF superfamily